MNRTVPQQRALLIVGSMKTRPFVLEQAVRTSRACGVFPVLIDHPRSRVLSRQFIPDANFVAAEIEERSANNLSEIADRLVRLSKARGIVFTAVYTGFNAYAELAAILADRLHARGNTGDSARRAHTKSLMREALSGEQRLTVGYRIVDSSASALLALHELGPPVVMKPARGAGSRGVRTDISSDQEIVAAWESVRSELARWRGRSEAALHLLDEEMPIMVEQQLFGREVDVELVLQDGRQVFAAVADNPEISLPHSVETCTTYPSLLPPAIQDGLIHAACRALRKLKLTDGNFHVEMVQTTDGPRVIEVNARMGGAFVWDAIKCVYGVDLVELGVKAVLGVAIEPVPALPCCALEACFFVPSMSGFLVAVEGFEALSGLRGFRAARLWKQSGDAVVSPPDDASDYLGFAAFDGANSGEARSLALEGLRSLRFKIRTDEGREVESPGLHLHGTPAAVGLYRAPGTE